MENLATDSTSQQQPADMQTIPVRESLDAELTSCPQTAVNTEAVWMTVAVIMTLLAITATTIAVVMGFLLYVKNKQRHSREANSDVRLGEFIY